MLDFHTDSAREQMIQQQIRAAGVLNPRTLSVLREVARETFVPEGYETLAFADCEIPIGHGESMLAPMIEARCLDALDIRPSDRILEIGTGSGYFTACLAKLGRAVVTVDLHADFVDQARERHHHLSGLAPIVYLVEDGHRIPDSLRDEHFDVIVLTGSLYLPEPSFSAALAPDGRLWVAIGTGPVQDVHRIERVGNLTTDDRVLFETRLTPLTHAPRPPGFHFV